VKFSEVVAQAIAWLQREGRVSYRALKREFELDDAYVADLKEEIIAAKRLAVDEDGKVLVWTGGAGNGESENRRIGVSETLPQSPTPNPQPPISYTPPHLAERIRAEQAALEARSGTDGERKTITALFTDLKGSTALIEGLDPEEARAIIDPALQLMMDAVHRYEGYVAQALGDGIFALFGAPIAHEDHPQRALYAALRMQEEMRRYGDILRTKGYPPLLMRVGLNTGEVVVRSIRKDDLHTDYVPVGHSTNLAARMEQLAAPGSILITAHTHKLTDGYFAFKALGETQIKGVEEPLNIYEVLSVGRLRTRLQVAARRGLTRFVGRQSEMEQLQRALEQAKAGHGQIVGVMGEPGLGKSRLFHEFVGAHGRAPLLVLQAYSVSHGKASPYLPLIELLKGYFHIELHDDERTRRQKVIGKVLELDRSLEDTLPYLFALLGIEEQPSPLQQMDAQIRRRRTLEALKKLFLRESLNQPLILIFEDLHWIDSETQGFLDVLSESVASAKVLLLVNYRPEYRPEWGSKTYYTQLRLAPFGKAEAEEFLDVLLGTTVGATGRSPLHDLKQLILDKTQGTPFFMEEIVQDLFEQGLLVRNAVGARRAVPLPTDLHIPTTVQGVLAARIDRLAPEEKALLQQLAVIGREFPLNLLRHVIPQPEDELYRLLSSLQRKEFLYEQPAFPEPEYTFKHALTQEVAYNTVLQGQRKALHERTAQAIEQLFHTKLDDHYSELAHHYRRSGNTEKAIEYLHLAGRQAAQRSANAEAINHFSTALELLKTLPDTPERDQQELALQLLLGPALMATLGMGAAEVGQVYGRARALCERMGVTFHLSSVLFGLWAVHVMRGEHQITRELSERLMRLAQDEHDSAFLVSAHTVLGATFFWLGEFSQARTYLDQGIALYNPQEHSALAARHGYDPGIACHCYPTLWILGYPDQARRSLHQALSLAHSLSHPSTLRVVLYMAAWFHQCCGEGRAVQECAEALIALCDQYGFTEFAEVGVFWRGWALVEQGRVGEGLRHMSQGQIGFQTKGGQTTFLAVLAEVYGKRGQIEEGLKTVADALQIAHDTGERLYEAELNRLRGELMLAQSSVQRLESRVKKSGKSKVKRGKLQVPNTEHPTPSTQAEAEAEACFLKAIEIARKQQAKSLELRAVMSLVRLRQQQAAEQGAGSTEQSAKRQEQSARSTEEESRNTQHETRAKLDEAHRMLSEVHNWFTEGFDTKDLQEAKALLGALSH
jgi:class 3 adenylate cyclase/predicted ATPase